MPRVETPDIPEERETRDYCQLCYIKVAPKLDREGWEVDVDHPPYEHHDYKCHKCGQLLSKVDNIWKVPESDIPGTKRKPLTERP